MQSALTHRTLPLVLALLLGAPMATAQEAVAPSDEPPADTAEPAPDASAPESGPDDGPSPAPTAQPVAAPEASAAPDAVKDDVAAPSTTIAERGGLFGIGLSVAPKVGGGLGSILLGAPGMLFELELGYSPPIFEMRSLQVFTSWSYAGSRSWATVDDPRVPSGSYEYALAMHQLGGTHGLLYRVPLDVVPWWRPYAAVGLRTLWSWTFTDGAAGTQIFGEYLESGFDLGGYGAIGSDFYVGPGAILAELQLGLASADRALIRSSLTLSTQLVAGYRFYF
jgi:hypothetical protein